MITIEYTKDLLENEAGPNFYWRGTISDYLRLVVDLHGLGKNNNTEIDVTLLKYVNPKNGIRIVLRSSEQGRLLVKVNKGLILIDLDASIWRILIPKFLSVSFYPSHEYIEFDDLDLIEDANFIISSEVEQANGTLIKS